MIMVDVLKHRMLDCYLKVQLCTECVNTLLCTIDKSGCIRAASILQSFDDSMQSAALIYGKKY